jgi:hypothetical protein
MKRRNALANSIRAASERSGTLPIRARRGVTLVVVLLLLSVTLGLSYAVVRSQTTALQIQQNARTGQNRSNSARQAAITGMTLALKHMKSADWNGVEEWAGEDSVFSGSLGPHERYVVTFKTGDLSLEPDDPEYEHYPYRVTVLSTGYAADAASPDREVSHEIEAVVELIPRALGPEPAEWHWVQSKFTVYQWTEGSCEIHVPCRIEGRIRFQERLRLGKGQPNLGESYAWPDEARELYLKHLATKESLDGREYPPFGWPEGAAPETDVILLYLHPWDSNLIDFLNDDMRVPTKDLLPWPMAGWHHPGELLSYRLYPGGKVYGARILPTGHFELKRTTLKPDTETNPLGLYYHRGRVDLADKVTIQGTLITRGWDDGDVHVFGKDVQIVPHDLPALDSDPAAPVRLPGVLVEDDFRIHPGAECSLVGMLGIWDDFEVMPHRQVPGGLSGTAKIEEIDPVIDTRCSVRDVALHRSAPQFETTNTVPVGARFTAPRSDTVYTVIGRTPVDGDQPTESIRFSPSWGTSPPDPGDVITFMPPEHDLTILSRIVCQHFSVGGRMDWWELGGCSHNPYCLADWWEDRYEEFEDQLGEDGEIDSFTKWLAKKWQVDPRPPVLITPDPTPARYHWRDLNDPHCPYDSLYVPGEDDEGGLRWDLVRWTELGNPD